MQLSKTVFEEPEVVLPKPFYYSVLINSANIIPVFEFPPMDEYSLGQTTDYFLQGI